MCKEEDQIYQPDHFDGRFTKKLAGVVVTAEQLPDTLLIEDDASYMVKGEEPNLLLLPSDLVYASDDGGPALMPSLHKAYLLAGLMGAILSVAQRDRLTLTQAAMQVRDWREGQPLTLQILYAGRQQPDYYLKGLEILRPLDPSLRLLGDLLPA